MNFLGHMMISLEIDRKPDFNKDTLYGNFAGDFYKGRIEELELPEEVKEGLSLHRLIDGITDREDNFLNDLLSNEFGLFKGIVSDMFIDHFLSKNFYSIFNENINDIEKEILYNIEKKKNLFTEEIEYTFNWISSNSVLIRYAEIDFLDKSFIGISRRVRKGDILRKAVHELTRNYNEFEEKSIKEFSYVRNMSIGKFFKKNGK